MNDNLFGMGNPLLDIVGTVNLEIIKKYGLKENDAILAEDKHVPLYEELVQNFEVEYIPGGATQNSIKVAQWILNEKYATSFSGCVKDDHYGKILQESCEKIGVRTLFQFNQGQEPTGLCAALITGHNRSMVTSLGASCKFTSDHLDKPDIWKFVEKAKIYYISAFFITSSHESLIKVAKHSLEHNKTFCFNLGAEFLVEFFNAQLLEAIEYSDFIFGNEMESLKLAHMCKFNTTDMKEIAVMMSKLPFKKSNKQRTIVITQGSEPTIVVQNGVVKEFPIAKLKAELIIDTTGAGDAFVGGFLAQMLHNKSLEDCVRCGKWAAEVIIQQAGCTFPNVCQYKA